MGITFVELPPACIAYMFKLLTFFYLQLSHTLRFVDNLGLSSKLAVSLLGDKTTSTTWWNQKHSNSTVEDCRTVL